MNLNLNNVESPPIDYFNHLLDSVKSNNKKISFGHGIPRYTPNKYANINSDLFENSNSFKYTDIRGDKKLRNYLAEYLSTKLSFNVNPDENLIITPGANSAIFKSLFLLLNKNDEVLVISPVYFNYIMAIEMIGAKPIEINSHSESGFQLNIRNIANSITNKTKAIIINSPNNPTGAVYKNDDLEELFQLCESKDIKVIFDITYFEYIHSNNESNYLSLLKSFDNVIITGSFSKTFGITGLRIGYISTKSNYIDNLCKIQDTISICASSLSQQILINLIKYEQLAIETNLNSVKLSKEILISNLINIPELSWIQTDGAFYAFVKLNNNMDSWNFTEKLINSKSVLVLPGSIFGSQWKSYMRLAYGALCSDDVNEGMKRIKSFIEEIT
tara:strand:- start:8913 stop:10073 length:1161 start_codon:yes stop_codon:yes gene_type:complete